MVGPKPDNDDSGYPLKGGVQLGSHPRGPIYR